MTQADDPGAANAVPKKGRRMYSDAKIMAALKASNGGIYFAASKLGCDPMTIYRRADKNPKVQAVVDNARGELVDLAEAALKKAVSNCEGWAVCFTLKTQGKDRGYVERTEHELTGKGGGPIATQQVFDHASAVAALAARSAEGGGESGGDPDRGDGEEVG